MDRFNVIEAGACIGHERLEDEARYKITESGVVVIPEGTHTLSERTSFSEDH